MLTDWVKMKMPEEEEIKERIKKAQDSMESRQLALKEHGLPVIVLLEGWGAAGKGSMIGKLIRNLDPRFFKVLTPGAPSEEEKRRPFLYRYFTGIPQQGKILFMDGGWIEQVTREMLQEEISDRDYRQRIQSIRVFERQLSDNGYLLIKCFLQVNKKEQKKRLSELQEDKDTSWRVSEFDLWQNKHYDRCLEAYDRCLRDTDLDCAPWYIIDAEQRKWAELQLLETLLGRIDTALKNQEIAVPIRQNPFPLKEVPKLSEIRLDQELSKEDYKKELEKYQKELSELHNRLYRKKVPVVIVYEGWDAAGKGGNIKRLTEALDPRGYEVHPIASPEPHEKARHYLWRFWKRLPKTGHVAIFDRSWYGRVMVERVEGFCSENEWQRAFHEMNEFEKELDDWGAVIIKFWVQIDKDTQLERFREREETPEKRWKITDEDWRNREKWDSYETAVNEMLEKTSTEFAPWHILESDNKYYARIKALRIVTEALKKKLD